MAGKSTTKRGPLRSRLGRIVLALGVAGMSLVLSPGTASAAGGTITPKANCVMDPNATVWEIVLGYTSTYTTNVTVPLGNPANYISISGQQGVQETVFKPGTNNNVFLVRMPRTAGGESWKINGSTMSFGTAISQAASTRCASRPAALPADGNGTGTVIALGAAGLVGAAYVARTRRRLRRADLTEDGGVDA